VLEAVAWQRPQSGGGLEKTADAACEQRASGLNAVRDDILNDDRRGNGAKIIQKPNHGDANGFSANRARWKSINIFKAGVGHKCENALVTSAASAQPSGHNKTDKFIR